MGDCISVQQLFASSLLSNNDVQTMEDGAVLNLMLGLPLVKVESIHVPLTNACYLKAQAPLKINVLHYLPCNPPLKNNYKQ
mmetsp:Transcript_11350/g.15154  ORF Transcript_11350/g.15154 Transcript_11350/m.15154 type:complete len:81 (-) Transcript_11350:371-613(-)